MADADDFAHLGMPTPLARVIAEAINDTDGGEALVVAEQALGVAQGAESAAADADQTANDALDIVEDVSAALDTAVDNSALALSTANDAASAASGAVTTANNAADQAQSAYDYADTANTAAGNAQNAAEAAQNSANAAQTAADDAQATANDAANLAQSAYDYADTANTAAGNAQQSASDAQASADDAQDTADQAILDAAAAQSTASGAVVAANSAADSAAQSAADAQAAVGAIVTYYVATDTDRLSLTPSPDETAFVSETGHIWEYDGSNWIDRGAVPFAMEGDLQGLSFNIGKIFSTRQEAIDAGQASLPNSFRVIATREGSSLVLRGYGQSGDPLFGAFPFWGAFGRIVFSNQMASQTGLIRLQNISGTDAITADFPIGLDLSGLGNLACVSFRPAGINSADGPTLTYGTAGTRELKDSDGETLRAGALDPSRYYVFQGTGNNSMQMLGRPMTQAEYDGILSEISAAQENASAAAAFIPALEQMTVKHSITRGQSDDFSSLGTTSKLGSATMILSGSSVPSGGKVSRFKVWNPEATPQIYRVTSWTDNGDDSYSQYASQLVEAQPGYNDLTVSVAVPANGLVGWNGQGITGVNSSLPQVPVYSSTTEVTEMVDPNLVSTIRFMVAFDIETIEPSIEATADDPVTDGRGLHAYRAKIGSLAAGYPNQTAKIVICGDSWTERPVCVAQPLADTLWGRHGQSGTGWISVDAERDSGLVGLLGGASLSASGVWTTNDMVPATCFGIDGFSKDTTDTGATLTVTDFQGDRIRWFYEDGSGSFEYSIDGGSPVTVAGTGAGGVVSIDVSGLTTGLHTLEITHATTAGLMRHYGGYATNTSGGVEVSKAGNGGSTGTQWTGIAGNIGAIASVIQPDLVIVLLGTNDARLSLGADQFEQGFRDVISAYQAVRSDTGFICVVASSVTAGEGKGLYEEYVRRLRTIRSDTPNVEIVSLFDLWPDRATSGSQGLWEDGLHPNIRGGWVNAGLIDRLLR